MDEFFVQGDTGKSVFRSAYSRVDNLNRWAKIKIRLFDFVSWAVIRFHPYAPMCMTAL